MPCVRSLLLCRLFCSICIPSRFPNMGREVGSQLQGSLAFRVLLVVSGTRGARPLCAIAVHAFVDLLGSCPCFVFLCAVSARCFPGATVCFGSISLTFEALFDLVLWAVSFGSIVPSIDAYPIYDSVVCFLWAPCEDDN